MLQNFIPSNYSLIVIVFSEFSLDLACQPGDLENLPLKFVRDTDEVLRHATLELSLPPGRSAYIQHY
jgi:hypothetical protein